MKRIFLFLLCLLLAVGSILSLTACNSETDTKQADINEDASTDTKQADTNEDASEADVKESDDTEEILDYYDYYKDRPAIEASDAAYLLNTEFSITSENFVDCAEDYFSAPGVLYFIFTLPATATNYTCAIKDCEKASDFSEIFRNASVTAIPEDDDYFEPFREKYTFYNAIGCIGLRSWQEYTYISFYRTNSTGDDLALFRADGDLIPECKLIADSLKADSIEVPLFEPPH